MRNTSQGSGWLLAPDGNRCWHEPHPNLPSQRLYINATMAASKVLA
jgi:hypothetical protein